MACRKPGVGDEGNLNKSERSRGRMTSAHKAGRTTLEHGADTKRQQQTRSSREEKDDARPRCGGVSDIMGSERTRAAGKLWQSKSVAAKS